MAHSFGLLWFCLQVGPQQIHARLSEVNVEVPSGPEGIQACAESLTQRCRRFGLKGYRGMT